ncbi:MAG: cation:proton antiporter [Methanomassiliicoccaceae archaeon]|jgi:Kef-type K+ transport system membrane component KefB|nr:cation:proton antiporter [Methanomassiliicoccaceae archaeon]
MSAEFEMGQLMVILTVLFILAFSASAVFKRFGIPGLIGEILIGVLVAAQIGDWSVMEFLGIVRPVPGDPDSGNFYWNAIEILAQLGVVFLLFTVGLETKVKELTSVGRTALLVAVLGVILPFIAGYAVIMMWDGNLYHAMFMGAAMVATSVGITAQVIKDLNLMSASESRIIIGAAVIDDVLGLIVLTMVAGMARTGSIEIINVTGIIVISSLFVILLIVFCAKGVPRIAEKITAAIKRKEAEGRERKLKGILFPIALIVCLVLSSFAAQIGLAMIVGAFLAGMIFAEHAEEHGLIKKTNAITIFLLPFFFVYVGLHIDTESFTSELLLLAAVVIVLAMITKYVGCGAGTILGDRERKSSAHIVGIGMIPRGEVGIIVATLGVAITVNGSAAMSADLFAVVVMMSVVTTIIAPFMFSRVFRKKYGKGPAA